MSKSARSCAREKSRTHARVDLAADHVDGGAVGALRPHADHADELDGHEAILARGDALGEMLGVLADAAQHRTT